MSERNYETSEIVESTRFIDWVDGHPIQRQVQAIKKNGLGDLLPMVLAQPYIPSSPDEAERFRGMNNAEVMMQRLVKAATEGHLSSTKEVLDRTLGKAVQEVKSLNVNVTYQDFLNQLIEEEQSGGATDYGAIDADILHVASLGDGTAQQTEQTKVLDVSPALSQEAMDLL